MTDRPRFQVDLSRPPFTSFSKGKESLELVERLREEAATVEHTPPGAALPGMRLALYLTQAAELLEQQAQTIEGLRAENERERYLPMDCPNCGRRRLLFTPATNVLRCEKCERSEWDRDEQLVEVVDADLSTNKHQEGEAGD